MPGYDLNINASLNLDASLSHSCYGYILSVYSPFSERVGLPLHNIPFPGVLVKNIGAAFFDWMPFLTSTTCVDVPGIVKLRVL